MLSCGRRCQLPPCLISFAIIFLISKQNKTNKKDTKQISILVNFSSVRAARYLPATHRLHLEKIVRAHAGILRIFSTLFAPNIEKVNESQKEMWCEQAFSETFSGPCLQPRVCLATVSWREKGKHIQEKSNKSLSSNCETSKRNQKGTCSKVDCSARVGIAKGSAHSWLTAQPVHEVDLRKRNKRLEPLITWL